MHSLLRPGDRDEIVDRLNHLQPDSSALWGRMTAPQMICHLIDSFGVGIGEKQATPAMNLFTKSVMKWGALYFPMQWPRGVPTRPEMDQLVGGTPPAKFEVDRSQLSALIIRFAQPGATRGSVHPIFGVMSYANWMRWGYLHSDHHFRQFGI